MRNFYILVAAIVALVSVSCCFSGGAKDDFFVSVNSGDLYKVKEMTSKYPSLRDAYLNDGWTALTIAAREGNVDAVNLLIAEGVDVNKLEGGGNSALFWAVYYGHEEVVSLLLRHQARTDNRCQKCRDPEEVAREKGYGGILKLLIEHKSVK
jgi:ankyrin repeat protein